MKADLSKKLNDRRFVSGGGFTNLDDGDYTIKIGGIKMPEFKQYRRKGLSEMVPFKEFAGQDMSLISVSEADKKLSNEEFEQGYIARNPKNHKDMWYVAKKYFDENLEPA